MVTLLDQVKAAKHAAAVFIDSAPGTDIGTGLLRVILSDDLQNWWSLEGANYPTASIRDPSVMIENGIYYFLSGNSLWSTKDFIDWENITINLANNDGMLWASEFFEDADHCHHIVYSATANGDNNADHFKLYVADLSDNMQVSNRHQIVSLPVTINSPIDANISLIDNNYYLWLADDNDKNTGGSALHFFKSDNYLNGWTEITTNINSYRGILANETQFEAPELIFDGQFAYLFFDPYGTSDRPGLCYSVAKADNLTNWTTPKVIGFNDFKARHMGLFPETEATVEKLVTLARLPDNFESFVLINAYQNGVIVFKSINELYQDLDGLFYFGAPPMPVLAKCPSTYLNRTAYLWLNQVFNQLQDALNRLIIKLNSYGVVGKPNYTDTPQISLWLPQPLSLATYQVNINQNWQSIEDKLNDCYLYLEPYITKGVS